MAIAQIQAQFTTRLTTLTTVNKPLLDHLTKQAKEFSPVAILIVDSIQSHLSKVAPTRKLPILCLIDRILKRVGDPYTELFAKNIVIIYRGMFKLVDHDTRSKMLQLRRSWDGVFPPTKLFNLDVQMNMLDRRWPVVKMNVHQGSAVKQQKVAEVKPKKTQLERFKIQHRNSL